MTTGENLHTHLSSRFSDVESLGKRDPNLSLSATASLSSSSRTSTPLRNVTKAAWQARSSPTSPSTADVSKVRLYRKKSADNAGNNRRSLQIPDTDWQYTFVSTIHGSRKRFDDASQQVRSIQHPYLNNSSLIEKEISSRRLEQKSCPESNFFKPHNIESSTSNSIPQKQENSYNLLMMSRSFDFRDQEQLSDIAGAPTEITSNRDRTRDHLWISKMSRNIPRRNDISINNNSITQSRYFRKEHEEIGDYPREANALVSMQPHSSKSAEGFYDGDEESSHDVWESSFHSKSLTSSIGVEVGEDEFDHVELEYDRELKVTQVRNRENSPFKKEIWNWHKNHPYPVPVTSISVKSEKRQSKISCRFDDNFSRNFQSDEIDPNQTPRLTANEGDERKCIYHILPSEMHEKKLENLDFVRVGIGSTTESNEFFKSDFVSGGLKGKSITNMESTTKSDDHKDADAPQKSRSGEVSNACDAKLGKSHAVSLVRKQIQLFSRLERLQGMKVSENENNVFDCNIATKSNLENFRLYKKRESKIAEPSGKGSLESGGRNTVCSDSQGNSTLIPKSSFLPIRASVYNENQDSFHPMISSPPITLDACKPESNLFYTSNVDGENIHQKGCRAKLGNENNFETSSPSLELIRHSKWKEVTEISPEGRLDSCGTRSSYQNAPGRNDSVTHSVDFSGLEGISVKDTSARKNSRELNSSGRAVEEGKGFPALFATSTVSRLRSLFETNELMENGLDLNEKAFSTYRQPRGDLCVTNDDDNPSLQQDRNVIISSLACFSLEDEVAISQEISRNIVSADSGKTPKIFSETLQSNANHNLSEAEKSFTAEGKIAERIRSLKLEEVNQLNQHLPEMSQIKGFQLCNDTNPKQEIEPSFIQDMKSLGVQKLSDIESVPMNAKSNNILKAVPAITGFNVECLELSNKSRVLVSAMKEHIDSVQKARSDILLGADYDIQTFDKEALDREFASCPRLTLSDSPIKSNAIQNDCAENDELEDGVTLDLSIADVSGLTNPTCLRGKVDFEFQETSSLFSKDLSSHGPASSEASSSYTSEAATPLIKLTMRTNFANSSDDFWLFSDQESLENNATWVPIDKSMDVIFKVGEETDESNDPTQDLRDIKNRFAERQARKGITTDHKRKEADLNMTEDANRWDPFSSFNADGNARHCVAFNDNQFEGVNRFTRQSAAKFEFSHRLNNEVDPQRNKIMYEESLSKHQPSSMHGLMQESIDFAPIEEYHRVTPQNRSAQRHDNQDGLAAQSSVMENCMMSEMSTLALPVGLMPQKPRSMIETKSCSHAAVLMSKLMSLREARIRRNSLITAQTISRTAATSPVKNTHSFMNTTQSSTKLRFRQNDEYSASTLSLGSRKFADCLEVD